MSKKGSVYELILGTPDDLVEVVSVASQLLRPRLPRVMAPALRTAVLKAVRAGLPPETAFATVGYPPSTLPAYLGLAETCHWEDGEFATPQELNDLVEFVDKLKLAAADFEQSLVARIFEAAQGVEGEKRDWKAAAWLLERQGTTRKHWRPYREPTATTGEGRPAGAIAAEHREARVLSDSELVEGIGDPEWAALLR